MKSNAQMAVDYLVDKWARKNGYSEDGIDGFGDINSQDNSYVDSQLNSSVSDSIIENSVDSMLENPEEIGYNNEKIFIGKAINIGYGTLDNIDARKWYLEQEKNIESFLNINASLENQAKQAFRFRNTIRSETRKLMKDRDMARFLEENEPNLTWDELYSKYYNRGYRGEEIFKQIISSSQRSRKSVNESLGLGGHNDKNKIG